MGLAPEREAWSPHRGPWKSIQAEGREAVKVQGLQWDPERRHGVQGRHVGRILLSERRGEQGGASFSSTPCAGSACAQGIHIQGQPWLLGEAGVSKSLALGHRGNGVRLAHCLGSALLGDRAQDPGGLLSGGALNTLSVVHRHLPGGQTRGQV